MPIISRWVSVLVVVGKVDDDIESIAGSYRLVDCRGVRPVLARPSPEMVLQVGNVVN